MDATMMMKLSAILLAMTAAGGLFMAYMRFKGTPRPPAWLVSGHGLAAVAGLTFLIYAVIFFEVPLITKLALGLFILAAAGGIGINILFHMKLLPLPIPLILLHASLAIIGFVFLLVGLFRQPLSEIFTVAPF